MRDFELSPSPCSCRSCCGRVRAPTSSSRCSGEGERDIITKTDLEQRQIVVLRQRNPNLRPNGDAELRKALQEITPEVIVDAVNELLFVQRGKELGYSLGDEQFRNIVDSIKKENKIETEAAAPGRPQAGRMTMEDLRKQAGSKGCRSRASSRPK